MSAAASSLSCIVAGQAGIPAIDWAILVSLGVAGVLAALRLYRLSGGLAALSGKVAELIRRGGMPAAMGPVS
jgi:hypothetical protein